jgi:ketosteroid isomerase-like protein
LGSSLKWLAEEVSFSILLKFMIEFFLSIAIDTQGAPLQNVNIETTVNDWVDAWNKHDLERILSHYAEDVEFKAPTVVARWKRADGVLRGKKELREHFRKGLELDPNLHFELEGFFISPDGYAILYRRNNGNRVIDSVQLDSTGHAMKVTAYYRDGQK